MGARTCRFIFFASFLGLFLGSPLFAQSPKPKPPGSGEAAAAPAQTPPVAQKAAEGNNPPPQAPQATFTPSFTRTLTMTPTATHTGTPGSPTATPTITHSPTVTPTPTSTAPTATPTLTPTKTPIIARSGMALLPTAYSNGLDRTDGFNLDLLFSYFIGAIVEKESGKPTEVLNPLRVWLLTADAKYGWLEEDGNVPALASGFINTLLLQGGNPGASGTSSGSLQFTTSSLGSVYTVASKSVAENSSVHLGYMRGNIRGAFGGAKSGFLGRLLPNRNHSELLPLFSQKLAPIRAESAPNIIYAGWDTKFLGTMWRFELWKPFPLSQSPVLLNTKIDRLFSFNLSYEKWNEGYAILGYFNFRFTIAPSASKKKF